jgi:hypothetical protein
MEHTTREPLSSIIVLKENIITRTDECIVVPTRMIGLTDRASFDIKMDL